MSVRMIDDGKGKCVMYDSTTQWAFGPVLISKEEAETFLAWLGRDPRLMKESDLETAYWDWQQAKDAIEDIDERAVDRSDA